MTSEHQPSKKPPYLNPATRTVSSSTSQSDVVLDNVASFLGLSACQSVGTEEVEGIGHVMRKVAANSLRMSFQNSTSFSLF